PSSERSMPRSETSGTPRSPLLRRGRLGARPRCVTGVADVSAFIAPVSLGASAPVVRWPSGPSASARLGGGRLPASAWGSGTLARAALSCLYLARASSTTHRPSGSPEIMGEAGLVDVPWRDLTGGIVALQVGTVPRG